MRHNATSIIISSTRKYRKQRSIGIKITLYNDDSYAKSVWSAIKITEKVINTIADDALTLIDEID